MPGQDMAVGESVACGLLAWGVTWGPPRLSGLASVTTVGPWPGPSCPAPPQLAVLGHHLSHLCQLRSSWGPDRACLTPQQQPLRRGGRVGAEAVSPRPP